MSAKDVAGLVIDRCERCRSLWFDFREFELNESETSVPLAPQESPFHHGKSSICRPILGAGGACLALISYSILCFPRRKLSLIRLGPLMLGPPLTKVRLPAWLMNFWLLQNFNAPTENKVYCPTGLH